MMINKKVEIILNPQGIGIGGKPWATGSVKIDGEEINDVREVRLKGRYDEVPSVELEIIGHEVTVEVDNASVTKIYECPSCGFKYTP